MMFGGRVRTGAPHVGPEIARDAGFVFRDKGGDIGGKGTEVRESCTSAGDFVLEDGGRVGWLGCGEGF